MVKFHYTFSSMARNAIRLYQKENMCKTDWFFFHVEKAHRLMHYTYMHTSKNVLIKKSIRVIALAR